MQISGAIYRKEAINCGFLWEARQKTFRLESVSFALCPPLYCSVAQSCLTLSDPMDCSTPGFPVLHHLPEFARPHVH